MSEVRRIIQLKMIELSDVVSVLQERGLELCYSVESDGVYLYGSESELAEVESILWARELTDQASNLPLEPYANLRKVSKAGVSYAIPMQK